MNIFSGSWFLRASESSRQGCLIGSFLSIMSESSIVFENYKPGSAT